MSIEVYDKAKWHLENDISGSREQKLEHLSTIVKWLSDHKLFNAYGIEIVELGIDEEFSLTSQMLTVQGNDLLQKYYKKWLEDMDYGQTPALEIFEEAL